MSKIAGYDFVYGDVSQWPRLYIANVDKFKDPANPDLIYPGQIIEIPIIDDAKGLSARTNDGKAGGQVVVGIFAKSRNVVVRVQTAE